MRFRGGLVFKARRLLYHSSLGQEEEKKHGSAPLAVWIRVEGPGVGSLVPGSGFNVWGVGCGVRGVGCGVWGVECGVWG